MAETSTRPPPGGTRRWLSHVFLAAGVGASVVFALLPEGGLAQAWLFAAVSAAAGSVVIAGFLRNLPERRFARYIMVLGWTATVVANYVWYIRPIGSGVPIPFPSVADALYFVYYGSLAAVLYGLIRVRSRGLDRTGILDAMIVAIGIATLSWIFVIAPYLDTPGLSPWGRAVAIAYPLSDIVLLGAMARLFMTVEHRPPAFWLLAAGIVAQMGVDTWFALAVLRGSFAYGQPEFVAWLISYTALGAAALHPSVSMLGQPQSRAVAATSRWLIAMGATALIAPTVLLVEAIFLPDRFSGRDHAVLALASAVLFTLVIFRLKGLTASLADLRQAQAALAESEARFRTTVETTKDWIWTMDLEGCLTYSNPAGRTLLGYGTEHLLEMNVFDLLHDEDREHLKVQLPYLLSGRVGWSELVLRWRHADGAYRSFESNSVPVLGETGEVTGFRATDRDVTERQALEEQLAHRAFHDPLTGLANRALFTDRMQQAMMRAHRSGIPFSVLMLDLDDFKAVNDTMGHEAGDLVLVEVATRMRERMRPSDTLARLGGDEFAAVLEATPASDAREIAGRLMESLRTPFDVAGGEVFVGATVGIAEGPDGVEGVDHLLRNADAAMYLAKLNGKGTARVFEPEQDARWFEQLGLISELRRALDHEELYVVFQPIVALETGLPKGVEALVRWAHPQRGEVSPGEFLPAAEQAGLVGAIDEYVLRQAALHIRSLPWTDPDGRPLDLSVNLSPRDLRTGEIVGVVSRVLEETGFPPERLTLEITEGALVEDTDVIIRRLEDLKALGVRLSIDDFGVGYSSLSYLRRLPVDEVKIDRSFVIDIASGSTEWALARSIVRMLHDLGFDTVAEGIEEAAQLAHLRALGCRQGQGFFFARPMKPEDLERYLMPEGVPDDVGSTRKRGSLRGRRPSGG